jgi:hypothetical protein
LSAESQVLDTKEIGMHCSRELLPRKQGSTYHIPIRMPSQNAAAFAHMKYFENFKEK